LLPKKFSKFLKKNRNKESNKERYDNKKTSDFNANNNTCYGCGEQGHIKAECPNKEKKSSKKEKKTKSKRAYIAWDENDVSSSNSSSSEDEEANLCLMVKEEDDASTVISCTSLNAENYSQLLQAFKETHEEANRLTLLNNWLKGLNNWLENRVKALEEELENSKTDFENPKMLYKNSSCKCDSLVWENCESLEKKVHYLVKTVDRLSKGKSNFETVLASQNCFFGKVGLGFNPQSKKNEFSKPFSKLPEKQPIEKSKQPVVSCFYFMKRGHSVRFCNIRKYYVPKAVMRWIPKNSEVPHDKVNAKGPTFVRGPNLVA